MIQINKVGNAIVIEFTDNDKYLFNGTIEVAPNELMVVVDQSNMVTFKKMSNGDTLFGQSYEKIRINDEPVTKENIVEKFATIGFTSGGGGGTGGAVDSVNGQTGTVIITASSLGAITKETADATYQPIGDYAVKSDLTSLATKSELNTKLDTSVYEVDKATFALKSELSDLVTAEQLNTKQDTLVSGTNIKTINGQTLLGEGNIEIQGGSGGGISDAPSDGKKYVRQNANWVEETSVDISGLATKEELNSKLDTSTYNSEKANFATKEELANKADASAIADMATKTWVGEQGYLTEIPSEYVTNSELTEGLAGKADKTGAEFTGTIAAPIVAFMRESQGMMGAIQADSNNILFRTYNAGVNSITFQVQNTAALKLTEAGIWENNQLLENKYAQLSDLNDFATTAQLNNKVDVSTYTEDKATFATKAELNLKANTSDLSNYLQTSVADEKYATKTELEGKVDDADIADMLTKSEAASTYQPKGEYATTSQLSGKQDTLVSGTNIKTVNGNSLLGEGDITIQGGGVGQSYYVEETLKGEIFNDYEGNVARGQYSHAEGSITRALGQYSHTEGWNTSTGGHYSHSEGEASRTGDAGNGAHAEGGYTVALDQYSHTEGSYTIASGANTHAEGYYTKTNNNAEHSQGKYNKSNTGATDDLKTIHSIGIGADEEGRKNAQEVMTNGDHYIIGIGGYDGTNPETAQTLQEVVNSGSITVDTAMSDTSENAVQNKVIKAYIDSLVGNILTQLQEINGTN